MNQQEKSSATAGCDFGIKNHSVETVHEQGISTPWALSCESTFHLGGVLNEQFKLREWEKGEASEGFKQEFSCMGNLACIRFMCDPLPGSMQRRCLPMQECSIFPVLIACDVKYVTEAGTA
ncbi:hypothetical protein VNO77_29747 [Canavalia gladiata]|uniref:Uncharacterized protein n=1 Tax=Canavalia gladiata TaxID=3824 RepID=A0AAN9Q2V7_CANGL